MRDENRSAVFLIECMGIFDACRLLSNADAFNVRSHLSTVRLTQGPLGAECKALGVATRGRMSAGRYAEISAAKLTVRLSGDVATLAPH